MSVASNDTAHLCYFHLVSLYDGEEASLSWGTEQLSDLTHFINLLHLWRKQSFVPCLAKTNWELRVNHHRYLGNLKSLPFFRPDADKTCSHGSIGERKKGNWRHETDLFWLEVQILNFTSYREKNFVTRCLSTNSPSLHNAPLQRWIYVYNAQWAKYKDFYEKRRSHSQPENLN